MRVDFTNFGFEAPEKSKTGRASQSGTAASPTSARNAGASGAGADQTSFSFDPARVEALTNQALAAPEVRQEKVAPLQQAVANGEYAVDPVNVAAAIAGDAGSFR
jgi:flagellar biosynthesis anti-sigma factor FlgM